MDSKSVEEAIPVAAAKSLIEVTAPSDLPEGYVLPVDIGGQVYNVTVPEGVKHGQKFTAEYTARVVAKTAPSVEIPIGRWRDGLCDCCRYGCCHPMCCNSYWCTLIANAQVMTRLNLNPCAEYGNAANTFKVAIIVTISFILFNWIMDAILLDLQPDEPVPSYILWPKHVVFIAFWIYLMVVIIKTRMHIRHKYQIPSYCCGCMEDCICAFCCHVFVVSQMGRHTTNYGTHQAYCCTRTGLNPSVPSLDDMEQQPTDQSRLL